MFDPYHKWLAIPPGRRPPTHYQLLGVAPEEKDLEIIEEAALGRTAHLRTYQSGEHAAECAKLLNEIAQAVLVLRDPSKRKEYDAELLEEKEYLTKAKFRPYNAPLASEQREAVPPIPLAQPRKPKKSKRPSHHFQPKNKGTSPVVYIAVSVGVTALVVLGAVIMLSGSGKGTLEEHAERGIEATKDSTPPSSRTPPSNRTPTSPPTSNRSDGAPETKPPKPPPTEDEPTKPADSPPDKPDDKASPKKPDDKPAANLAKVDLLKLVNLQRQELVVKGRWRYVGKALVSPLDDMARIQIPYVPPEEYDIRVVAERKQGVDTMVIGLVLPKYRTFVNIDAGNNIGYHSGFQGIDGLSLVRRLDYKVAGPQMVKGRPNTIFCKVRKQDVSVAVNDREIVRYQGDFSRLRCGQDWEGPIPQVFILGSWQSSYHFTAVELTPLSVEGKVLE
jgi:hypothetical protein